VPRALPRVCCNTAKVGDNEGRISGENGEQGSAKEMGENMAVGRVEVEVCGRGRGAGRRGGRARILLRRAVGRIRGMFVDHKIGNGSNNLSRSVEESVWAGL
jgi:hypothetical protein